MARQESDRENLLRDATALVERIELAPADSPGFGRIVLGFRNNGAASIYFGDDAAYHFNSRGKLRRAYQDGLLFKAEQEQLFSLERVRRADAVELRRRQLRQEEQATFAAALSRRLRDLGERCKAGEYTVIGQVPAEGDVLSRVLNWLQANWNVELAKSPYAR